MIFVVSKAPSLLRLAPIDIEVHAAITDKAIAATTRIGFLRNFITQPQRVKRRPKKCDWDA